MRRVLFVCLILFTTTVFSQPTARRADISNYLDQISHDYHFDRQQLTTLFNQVHLRPKVVNAITHPYESRSWDEYRNAFVSPKRIHDGVEYYHRHQALIEKIAQKYQIPGTVLVAFLGIESDYGRRQSQYSTMNALTTLGFNYPQRGKYFRSELTQLLLLCREQHFSPLSIQGSYAGALGMPQFMPSSYRRYAVDWDHHQHADLFHNHADVMASISNYLNHFGWQAGAPIAVQAHTDKYTDDNRVWHDLVHPSPITAKQLATYHLHPPIKLADQTPTRVIGLVDKNGHNEYWLGLTNLKPILRYNNSTQYALSVMLLSQAIEKHLHTT